MNAIFRTVSLGAVALAALSLVAVPAHATPSASSTLHIGPGANTSCAKGGCPIFVGGALDGEVNNIEATQLDIYQNAGGAPTFDSPVWLILSVPNNVSVPTALSASLYAPYPDPSPPTAVTISAATFGGLMTSGDVYGVLGLGANASNSFTNYAAAYQRVTGSSVTSFGIYLFSIDTSAFGAHDLLDISLGALPEGTFAVAYGTSGSKSYATPFTEAGMVDVPPAPIPEPGSLAIFGAALIALGLMRRWKQHSVGSI